MGNATPWNVASGTPNCTRLLTCTIVSSSVCSAAPMHLRPMIARFTSKNLRIIGNAPPGSPTIAAAGTSTFVSRRMPRGTAAPIRRRRVGAREHVEDVGVEEADRRLLAVQDVDVTAALRVRLHRAHVGAGFS